jgi:hypothetical protein
VPGLGVAVLEDGVVHGQEVLGLALTHGDGHLQGEQPAVHLGPFPDGRITFGDVDLTERERQERHVPVGAVAQSGEHMVVGDPGVGAAVVVGQCEGTSHNLI